MCFKIKCKLNKVITELGGVGGGFLLETADTSISLSLTLNAICKCALYVITWECLKQEPKMNGKQFHGGTEKKKKKEIKHHILSRFSQSIVS